MPVLRKKIIVIKKNTRLNPQKDKNGYPSPLSLITGFNVGSYSEELEGYPERSVYIKIDCQELSAPTSPMTYALLLSIYVTCKLRGFSFPKYLKESLKHYIRTGKPLSLKSYSNIKIVDSEVKKAA